ncbi:hypothetical protein [Culicoidibacter larvae]|uniref:Uncharacterized protein n=1 Tax=Culicoidibacter larvae TaxID=2579976 RepID=A0A5R8QAJ3_9FIRM|nr:hypothetical protein [Culicoidibacter larvae]TLG72944.1 hypothetical protein FEZ08_07810 [Culicoidibacter larvae]
MFAKQVQLIENLFLEQYPDGFEDELWLAGEKSYKPEQMITNINQQLSKEELELTLESGDYQEAIDNTLHLVRQSKVISVFEKLAFQNFVEHQEIHEQFLNALYNFMYDYNEENFDNFIMTLLSYRHERNSKPTKWTVVSFFKAYQDPQNYIFVKPTTMKGIAKILDWDIQYKSMPNYQTYQHILAMIRAFQAESSLCRNADMRETQGVIYTALRGLALNQD